MRKEREREKEGRGGEKRKERLKIRKRLDPFSRSICNPRPGNTWDSVEGNAVLLWSFCTCNHGDLVSGNQVQWRLVGRASIPVRIRARFRERDDGTIYSEELKVQQDFEELASYDSFRIYENRLLVIKRSFFIHL